jgi:hypothetical protein
MLKILDETVKLSKTQPAYQLVINLINDGVDPDSGEMERAWMGISNWERKLTKLNTMVVVRGKAMIPQLYREVEQFIEDTEARGYETCCKEYLRLLKYFRNADFRFNSNRDFQKIWLDLGGTKLTKEELENHHNSLYEYFDNLIEPFIMTYGRSEYLTSRFMRKRFAPGILAAKFFHDIAPMFASIARISVDFENTVLELIDGKTPGLQGSLEARITNGLEGILKGKLTSEQARKVGTSFMSIMLGCLRAIPRMVSVAPYAIPLAQSLFPDVWKYNLEPQMAVCQKEDGTFVKWVDIEVDNVRGGSSMAQMMETVQYQGNSENMLLSTMAKNPASGTRKPSIVRFPDNDSLIELFDNAQVRPLQSEFNMDSWIYSQALQYKLMQFSS